MVDVAEMFFSSKLLLTLLQLEDNTENITITCLYDNTFYYSNFRQNVMYLF